MLKRMSPCPPPLAHIVRTVDCFVSDCFKDRERRGEGIEEGRKKEGRERELTREITANSKIIRQSLGCLSRNLRTPELSDVGICPGPATDGITANPHKLDVISVRNVE